MTDCYFHADFYTIAGLASGKYTNNNTTNNNNPLYPAAFKTNYVDHFTYNQFGGNLNGPL